MKRKTVFLALALALALIIGTFQTAFAAYPDAGIETKQKITDEVTAETVAMNLYKETKEGGYGLVDTATLKKWMKKNPNLVIIDTMPEDWYKAHHIKGAKINSFAPLTEDKVEGKDGPYTKAQKADLMKKVKKAVGKKTVTKYYNKKTKKWQTKKIKGAKTKKVTVVNKSKKIVVYCGFVVCTRSHVAAKYLVSQGFTNVYRYPGGISAWADANYPLAGSNPDPKALS